MHPPLPHTNYSRLASLGAQLWHLLEDLGDIPGPRRKIPLTRTAATRGLKLIGEACAFAGLPPCTLSTRDLPPGELFAEAMTVLKVLTDLNPQGSQATPRVHQKSYPRRLARA